jgi:CheY-like chemotaxis protein
VSLAPNQPRYRILIVDDDATNRQLLRELLAPFGFDLREAENGQQAIDIWQEFGPHLIWMDMRMPVLDGYEATKRIKKAEGKRQEGEDHSEQLHPSSFSPHPSPIIIALTASSFEEEKAEILAAGCDDFLRKPFREAELFRLMSQHIGVQFIHETVDPLPPSGDTDKDALTPDMLMPVPLEQLTQLAEAIELSDVAWATNIINNNIQPTQPELAAILSRLVNNFEYSTLLAAIGRVTSPKSD